MPKSTTSRKLELFALHCHVDTNKAANYRQFFQSISKARAKVRQLQTADKLIALPVLRFRSSDVIELIAYEGPIGVSPLIFDARTEEERIAQLASSAIVATRTHAVIDLESREAIIEYNQRGAKAGDIAEVLEAAATALNLGPKPAVELNPIADESFLKALDRFGVIRLANVRVAKPNIDWTDNYNHMTAVASESNARAIELTVSAQRKDTLSPTSGVVGYIRAMVRANLSALKGARVVGIRAGEQAQTTVSLANHIQHQKVLTAIDEHGHVTSSEIFKKIHAYLDARRKKTK